MRIAILTLGTRGDVQPYLALAEALIARGHDVNLAAPENFAAWIAARGVPFVPIPVDMEAFLRASDTRRFLSGDWRAMTRMWKDMVEPMMRACVEASWTAAADADVILHHPKMFMAVDVAEATGAVPILAAPVPLAATGDFPLIVFPTDLGRWLNRLTWSATRLSRWPYARLLNDWRRQTLGLGPGPRFLAHGETPRGHELQLYGISPSVLPRPADWPPTAHMTGYWFLDEKDPAQPLDPALEAFIAAGPSPVYIGFGSMTSLDPEKLTRAIVEGVRAAGLRAVLATGWGGVADIAPSDQIHAIAGAPHDRLFPKMRAVVHHGGAGTTAAGLRAGRPTLICPQAVDQPFWGRRVAQMGCGPDPLPLKRLTAARFAARLRALTQTDAYAARAAETAAAIAAEDGLARAVERIEAARTG